MCNLDDRKTIFEINCTSDGVIETIKTSLPCSAALDQSLGWISLANSVPLRILVVCILTRPMGSSKYGTTRKNTQQYYTTKRLIRYIYFIVIALLVSE